MKLHLSRDYAALVTLVVFLVFLAFAAPGFFSWSNLREVALSNLAVLLVAAGMTLVIVVAQIDISVGSMFAICVVCCGLLARAGVPSCSCPLSASWPERSSVPSTAH